jgi:hypothetical protein
VEAGAGLAGEVVPPVVVPGVAGVEAGEDVPGAGPFVLE